MAVFTRLSLVVIASSAICAGSLAGLALVESALVRTSSSSSMRRPPDSSSLFMLGAVFFTQWLGTTAYLPLIDWSEVGSRRVYERLGALGLSWVSYTALLSILVGSATHKTAILVVSPFLRVLGLATLQSLGNESSYGVNLGKLLKSCCFTVIDALVNTTSIWIVAFLVSFSDLSDTAQVSTVVTSLPIVVTMLAFEQLAYWHVAKSFQQSTVAEEQTLLETVSRTLVASMASVAIPEHDWGDTSTPTRSQQFIAHLRKILPAMLVSALKPRTQSITQSQW
ncbi:hypothetical protein DFJ73DRAFT_879645 [Zopfochytrium polystomum]|nr:hypothetical protein DFJ73DRAFT_879645 [Zopfochytrium polystomum]